MMAELWRNLEPKFLKSNKKLSGITNLKKLYVESW